MEVLPRTNELVGIWRCCRLETLHINSGVAAFSCSRLEFIHSVTSLIHEVISKSRSKPRMSNLNKDLNEKAACNHCPIMNIFILIHHNGSKDNNNTEKIEKNRK